MLISYKKGGPIFLKRKIKVMEDKFVIEEEINSPYIIDKIGIGVENPYIFIPSSRYFQIQDLKDSFSYHILEVNNKFIKIRREYDGEGKEKLTY